MISLYLNEWLQKCDLLDTKICLKMKGKTLSVFIGVYVQILGKKNAMSSLAKGVGLGMTEVEAPGWPLGNHQHPS